MTSPLATPLLLTPVGSAEFMAPEIVNAFLGPEAAGELFFIFLFVVEREKNIIYECLTYMKILVWAILPSAYSINTLFTYYTIQVHMI